jgi:hypothetical protein
MLAVMAIEVCVLPLMGMLSICSEATGTNDFADAWFLIVAFGWNKKSHPLGWLEYIFWR